MHRTAAAIYAYILTYKAAHDGNSPSIRDMMDGLGISSTSVVAHHLRYLSDAGRIHMPYGTTRNIQVPGGRWVAPVQEP